MSAIKINSNQSSRQVQRALNGHTDRLGEIYARLSSGKRINKASDDAAGLAIASQLNVDARLANRARLNVSDGISMLETALQATDALTSIVMRVRELAEQSANGTYSRTQREALNKEAQSLAAEYNRIKESTEFNNNKLLNGDSEDISIFAGIRGESAALQVGIKSVNGGQANTGSAIVLDGVDDSLVVAYDPSHIWRGDGFTVEMMVNIDPTENDSGILISQAFTGLGVYNYYLQYGPDGSLGFTTYGVDENGATTSSSTYSTAGALRFGEWQHVAVSVGSDKTLRLFIEGQKVAEQSVSNIDRFTSALPEEPTDLVIGTIYPSPESTSYPSHYLTKGSIDQIKISHAQKYSENFSPSLIQQNADASTALLLNFESSTGLNHSDTSNNRVTVTARNGAAIGSGYQSDSLDLAAFDLRFQGDARDALTLTASILENLSTAKGEMGASISRLLVASNSLSSLAVNANQAAGRIIDADVAEESSALVRTRILQQTSSALLAQANLQPSLVLKLLSNN